LGRGIEPLFSFSEGRTFRSAVRLRRRSEPGEEHHLGMLAHCHGCGDQQVQPLIRLRQWQPCHCPAGEIAPLAISGPLWIGPLQEPELLAEMQAFAEVDPGASLSTEGARLLARLLADRGLPARCWPMAEIARRLKGGAPPLLSLVAALREGGWSAQVSGVMPGQLRSDAAWGEILQTAAQLVGMATDTAK
jgi:tRNA (guanine26-N2/guanine27-N2)-dimethyltransferase